MVNTPIPSSLRSEAKKAANIIREFTIPNTKAGPDKIIPAGLVENAAGLAILTVVKVGFLVTARGGSGIVIARLNDGTWSAPSALGIAGLGGGLEIGAEVTDFVIILNKQSAVDAFSKGGNLTLGGNFTVAAGPLGRNLEGDVSVRSPAAIYTYSKTKGLFAGISIEGSCLIERKDANKKFYGEPLRAVDILTGRIEPPPACNDLYAVLDNHREMFKKAMVAQAKSHAKREVEKQATSRGYGGFVERVKSLKVKKESHRMRRTASGTITKSSKTTSIYESTEFCDSSSDDEYVPAYKQNSTSQVVMQRSQSVKSRPVSTPRSTDTKRKSYDQTDSGLSVKQSAPCPSSGSNWDQTIRVQAIWAFQGQLPCDLTFMPGDIIDVLTSTGSQNDWWEGNLNGHIGIFPANFTKLL